MVFVNRTSKPDCNLRYFSFAVLFLHPAAAKNKSPEVTALCVCWEE